MLEAADLFAHPAARLVRVLGEGLLFPPEAAASRTNALAVGVCRTLSRGSGSRALDGTLAGGRWERLPMGAFFS